VIFNAPDQRVSIVAARIPGTVENAAATGAGPGLQASLLIFDETYLIGAALK
jgi:hypothetical protein